MRINDLLDKYNLKYIPGHLKPNYVKLPKNFISATHEGMELFNELYKSILDEEYHTIVRSKSGGISIKRENLYFPSYDVRETKQGVEITLLTGSAMTRIIFSAILNRTEDKHNITGTVAWRLFKKTLNDFDINIEDYRISPEEGLKAKKEIKYCRKLANYAYKDLTLKHVHHIDFNSSYPAGLVNKHPEFKEAIEYLYNKRHENKVYKSILNNSISGYLQSKYVRYGFAHLCRDSINDNFDRLDKLTKKLEESGRIPLLYNSDGIWYLGEQYHDENEGPELGQYKHDYVDCTFRAKSDAAYEFIDKDGYHPKLSGFTRLDRIKDRSEWQWGDIYNTEATVIQYQFIKGEGIYEKTKEFDC